MRSYMSHIALCTLSNVISLLDRSLYQAQTLYAELRMAEDRRGGGVRKKKDARNSLAGNRTQGCCGHGLAMRDSDVSHYTTRDHFQP